MARQQEVLSSVYNAIRILKTFSSTETELGISELSVRLGLAKSTVYRLMKTLTETRLVRQNEDTQKYQLGIGAFELGFTAYHSMQLHRISIPYLEKLMESVRKVVRLGVYDNGGIVYLSKHTPDSDQATISKIGDRTPSYCSAVGKLLLAYQDDSEIDNVIGEGLYPYTAKTITNEEHFKQQIDEIRRVGYAVTMEELRIGICSVAIPVYNDMGKVMAAISVTGQKAHFYPNQIQQYVKEMKMYSRLITERLNMD
ncbi:IclR family transcriptional regulator [Aneurinibacillus sp. Ricciae_BoGa-3]|uniref:IclR family transcriptional regulator n=1 Tax=Aneurinibacillus sp. Ricciae_BoGa-3 TaxID=3022697 RepID=UPI00233F8C9C|nr:IclR family transcriptional regulator [Aneurinibacillus sp. Ricciae_BoGa-3]WCK56683.1 IclR family transcriptional regulator [Aneurinibacillus sp. Ricciae_BoGa-3]